MDWTALLSTSGASAGFIAIVLIVYKVLKAINNKEIRSKCCGRDIEIGMAVEDMPPRVVITPNAVPPAAFTTPSTTPTATTAPDALAVPGSLVIRNPALVAAVTGIADTGVLKTQK